LSQQTVTEGIWHLIPTEPPKIQRHCPTCDAKQPFHSADKFRVNGNGSRLDIWLIYKCVECDETWKATLYTRVRPSEIPPDLFDKFQHNDRETAWRYAFDEGLLRRCGVELLDNGSFEIQGPARAQLAGKLRIQVTFQVPCHPRTEQLLSRQLALSRRQCKEAIDQGLVSVEGKPSVPKRLSQPAVLLVDLEAIDSLA
jgi:hypothetical protein